MPRPAVACLALVLAAGAPVAADGPAPSPAASNPAAREVVRALEEGRYGDAETALRGEVEAGRGGPAARYLLGLALFRQLRFGEAEPLLRAAIEARPDRPAWLHTLAACLLEEGRCREAITVLDRALALDPRPRYRYDKAMCAKNVGDFDLARRELEAVVAAVPDDAGALAALAELAADSGDAVRARGLAERAVAIDPELVEPWLLLGRDALERGDLAGAAAAFRRVRALVPGHVGAAYNLGRALLAAGEAEEAELVLADFRRLTALQEQIENRLQYLQLDPTDLAARLDAVRLLLEAGRDDEAREQLDAARRLAPGDPAVLELDRAAEEPDGPG